MSNGIYWHHLKILLTVGRAGSIARAARELQTDHLTVARYLSAFEGMMGKRYVYRSGGRLHLTPDGQMMFRFSEEVEKGIVEPWGYPWRQDA